MPTFSRGTFWDIFSQHCLFPLAVLCLRRCYGRLRVVVYVVDSMSMLVYLTMRLAEARSAGR